MATTLVCWDLWHVYVEHDLRTLERESLGKMKFAIFGAGSVGCYYGALLANDGHDVILIGRPKNIDAIREDGLRVQSSKFDYRITLAASCDPADAKDSDVVLLCVKSKDTSAAAMALRNVMHERSVLISLQNGVENVELLRSMLPNKVIGAAVYVATEMAGPGHVLHHGRGDLVLEKSPVSAPIAQSFEHAGIPVSLIDNIDKEIWKKFLINCAYNAISAIVALPFGRLKNSTEVDEIMQGVVRECIVIAEAKKISLDINPMSFVESMKKVIPEGQYSSTAYDLVAGKKTEIDQLNGLIVRHGRSLGISTPVNQMLFTLVKIIEENKTRQIVSDNVQMTH
jgi:2-dehydropantoate 2-reductase